MALNVDLRDAAGGPDRATSEVPKVEALDRAECLALLATQRLGRLAVASEAAVGPHVVPVNYVLLHGSIVIRSIPGTKLDRLVSEPATFEVDSFDAYLRSGWSVVVEGLAYVASEEEMQSEEVYLRPFLERPDSRWVRLLPRSITGRRIAAGP